MTTTKASTIEKRPYGNMLVATDPADLARKAADQIFAWTTKAEGTVRVALSGGATPRQTYQVLAGAEFVSRFPWPRVHWYWGDERFVPPDDPDSNFRMVREAMFNAAPVPPDNIHPVPTLGVTPDAAAADYEKLLRRTYASDRRGPDGPLFDVCLLGLGEDGHTASLIPGTPALDDMSDWVTVVARGRPETRITLTYPAINLSRHIAFLVSGAGKSRILKEVTAGGSTVPAARLRHIGDLLFIADRDAVGT